MVLGRRGAYYGLLAAVLMFAALMLFAAPAWAQVNIDKDDEPDPVEVGEFLLYTLTVTNNSTGTEVVVVEDNLPDSVDLEDVSVSGGTADECEVNNNDPEVVCVIELAPQNKTNDDDVATIRILVDPDQVEEITNEAEVSEVDDPTLCEAALFDPDNPNCGPDNVLDAVEE